MKNQLDIYRKEENHQKKLLLSFSGELTMLHIEEVKQLITKALTSFDVCEADLRQVADFDFSFIQVLYALTKTLKAAGKSFQANLEGWSAEKKAIIANAGLSAIAKP